jgi:hypothetical protein
MRRWWLVIALLLSVGLNLGIVFALAARRHLAAERRAENPELVQPANDPLPRIPRLADRLGLEGEERRRFLDIQWNLYQETSRLRLQLGEVHRDLRRELTRPRPDRTRIDTLLAESGRIYLALEKSLVDNVLATRDLLGPDREKEYLQLVGRLRVPNPGGFGPGAGMGQGMGPGRGQGMGPGMGQRMGQRPRDRPFNPRFQGPRRFPRRLPQQDDGPPP